MYELWIPIHPRKSCLVSLFLMYACVAKLHGKKHDSVHGGMKDIDFPDWFWMAKIKAEQRQCFAVVLNEVWLLAPVDCFRNGGDSSTQKVKIILGKHSTDFTWQGIENYTTVEVTKSKGTERNITNIALVKMSEIVEFGRNVTPICLREDAGRLESFEGIAQIKRNCFTRVHSKEGSMKIIPVKILDMRKCTRGDPFGYRTLCAETTRGNILDTVEGEHGSPLICQPCKNCDWLLVGIISSIKKEGNAHVIVYSRIANYITWIQRHVKNITVIKQVCKFDFPRRPHWMQWTYWSSCSVTCRGGIKFRKRECRAGYSCTGREYQYRKCGKRHCPARCSTYCEEKTRRGYCVGSPEFMKKTCNPGCCGKFCADKRSGCENDNPVENCMESWFYIDCLGTCGFCPNGERT